eukprot:6464141-Amphidinium_carterae.2
MHYNVNADTSSVSQGDSIARQTSQRLKAGPQADGHRDGIDFEQSSQQQSAKRLTGRIYVQIDSMLITTGSLSFTPQPAGSSLHVQIDSMLMPAGSLSSIPQPAGSPVPYSLR